jgi:hypothetical protein
VKGRWTLTVITANLIGLVGLAFVYPHLMVSPGPLVAAHSELTTNCESCHAPWRGPEPARCVTCHTVASIGVTTTDHVPIVRRKATTAFHQELLDQNCNACHSDHEGPMRPEQSRKRFSHTLLRSGVREQCQTCHTAPLNRVHSEITGNCAQCHSLNAWKPATLDHNKFFVLDRNHNATCVTCHVGGDYKTYTCYGCHAHTEARIRDKHVEEGIRNFQNCVRCHRSASEGGEGGEGREGGGEREGRGRRER